MAEKYPGSPMAKKRKRQRRNVLLVAGGLALLMFRKKQQNGGFVTSDFPNLNRYFSLENVTASDTATAQGITEQFNPPRSVYENADNLAEKVLNKILSGIMQEVHNQDSEAVIDWEVSSWYRHPLTNDAVGGCS